MKFRSKFSFTAVVPGLLFAAASMISFVSGQTTVTTRPRTTPTTAAKASQSPTPTPVAVRIQTLDELQTKIRQRMYAPEVRRGRVGIKIISLNTGKVIFENDSEKYFMPASNMKNFTVATAMERLGPEFRFKTSVLAPLAADGSGTINGNVVVKGGGDISISNAFDPEFPKTVNPFYGIDRLVDRIAAAGIKRVNGDLIGDESYFQGFALPGTWEWDDLQSYYGTEISALPLNDNAIDVSVTPGSAGNQCIARTLPINLIVRIVNRCFTTAKGTSRQLSVVKLMNQNVLEIRGSMPAGDAEYRESVALTHPADLFIALLKQRLEAKGIVVSGRARMMDPGEKVFIVKDGKPVAVEITTLESPPFSVIAQKTMKPSQNMYTETILWTLGEQIGRKNSGSGDSSSLGLSVVRAFLKEVGIPDDGIIQHDGSGLSRHDLITPSAVVTLYTYMAKQSKYAQAWRDSLSIGGVDGTLRNRFKGTAAAGNIRGKTGTIDQVSALSGYMTTAAGEPVVLSIVVNGVTEPKMRTSLADDIVISLSNFNGKLD
ncbi:D-alanyl-D-alanine carboxypeptidase/D-alanyl-D-alanine-endopeptidase [soil metagenome]